MGFVIWVEWPFLKTPAAGIHLELNICISEFDKWSELVSQKKDSYRTYVHFELSCYYSTINEKTSKLWPLRDPTRYLQSLSIGEDEENGWRGRSEGRWRRAVSQLNGGVGRQSCSALHTPESIGSWFRLSWTCKSSRLATSYSGSDRCSRTGRGRRTQEKKAQRLRGGNHSGRQRAEVKGGSFNFTVQHIKTARV